MSGEKYGLAFRKSFVATVTFVSSKRVSRDHAEEIAQAAWADGREYRKSIREPSMVATWINSIALNLLCNWWKRPTSCEPLPEMPIPPATGPEAVDLERMLGRLCHSERRMLEQYYLEGRTSREIAAGVGSPMAVRFRLMPAKDRLKTMLHGTGRLRRCGPKYTPSHLDANERLLSICAR